MNYFRLLKSSNDTPDFSLKDRIFLCKVVDIYDGDSCKVVFNYKNDYFKWTIRMQGYDSPEIRVSKNAQNRVYLKEFGRYDIKYTSDELLKNTKDFKIIELNDLPQDDFSFSFINTIKRVEYGFWNIMLNNVALNDSLYDIYKKISKLNTCNQDKYYKNILMNIV